MIKYFEKNKREAVYKLKYLTGQVPPHGTDTGSAQAPKK